MNRRIFTFGCSFTNYMWPTWADIILYDNEGYNFGLPGAGYDHLLYTILQVDMKLNFTENDIIIIVLTQPIRFDVLISNNFDLVWMTDGNVITSKGYSKYLNKLFCIDGLLFKAYNNIILIDQYLKSKNLNYIFGSLSNLFESPEGYGDYEKTLDFIFDETKKLIDHVNDTVQIKLMSFDDFALKNGMNPVDNTKMYKEHGDGHPRPITHFKWVNDILLKYTDIEVKAKIEDIIEIEKIIDNAVSIRDIDILKSIYPKFFEKRVDSHGFIKYDEMGKLL